MALETTFRNFEMRLVDARRVAMKVESGLEMDYRVLQDSFDRLSAPDVLGSDDSRLRRVLWNTNKVSLED